MSIEGTINRVIDIIDERGHTKGAYIGEDGGVCLTHALSLACGLTMFSNRREGQYTMVRRDLIRRLYDAGFDASGTGSDALLRFNDDVVKDGADLIYTLRRLYA